MPVLYIIRGLPGSGKSTLAKKLVNDANHRETDMNHMIDGKYQFDFSRIQQAHEWCLKEIISLMKFRCDCAVANTFTRRWEYQEYIDAANKAEYQVMVIDCHGPWLNIHNVPTEVMAAMRDRWEPHIAA